MGLIWKLRLTGVAIVAAVLAYFGIRTRILQEQRDDALERAHDAEAYVHTRQRIDDATDDLGDDPAAARRWLRERSGR